jgi:hypothetical protein
MDAIDEFEEEIFDETLMFDLVCLGGGTAAGHWASALTDTDNTSTSSNAQSPLQERGLTAAIISGYPAGLPPYERSCLHTSALNPEISAVRDSSMPGFPAVDGHTAEWYAAAGSELSKAIKHSIHTTDCADFASLSNTASALVIIALTSRGAQLLVSAFLTVHCSVATAITDAGSTAMLMLICNINMYVYTL